MPDTDFLPFGAQYYRAPTPTPDQWERDLDRFRDHGFNTLKIWAQWRWNNPRDGEYDFSDLQRIMDLAAERGLRVIINAIYDVAPAWFFRTYPDSVMHHADGRRAEPRVTACRQIGGSPGPSYLHPQGIEVRRAFTEALAARFAGHSALYIWDLWNEPELSGMAHRPPEVHGLVDYSPFAIEAFVGWLRAKYGNLDALNHAWGRNYQTWDEVEPPRAQGTIADMVDWRVFFVDVLVEELRMRRDAVRARDTDTPVMVHTVPMPAFNVPTCASDEYKLAAECDLFGNSVGSHPFAAGLTVAAAPGKRVINAEIHARFGSTYNVPPACTLEDLKRHILVPLARGIEGFLFWQYRPETIGLESPAWGLTDLAGDDTPWLDHTRRINAALQDARHIILASHRPRADIAIVNGTANQVFDWCAGGDIDRHYKSVLGAYMALYHHHLTADVVSTDFLLEQDLSRYRVIVYPFPYYVEDAVAEWLRAYVEQGGALIAECFFGGVRGSDGRHSYHLPGFGFDAVFGAKEALVTMGASAFDAYKETGGAAAAEAEAITMLPTDALGGFTPGQGITGYRFAERLAPTTGDVLATFTDNAPAIVRNRFGAGTAVLIGTLVAYCYGDREAATSGRLLALLAEACGAEPTLPTGTPKLRADLLAAPGANEGLVVLANDTGAAAEARIALSNRLPDATTLRDPISGEAFEPRDGAFTISMEPGACRLLRAFG
jgi:beta-galactosidase